MGIFADTAEKNEGIFKKAAEKSAPKTYEKNPIGAAKLAGATIKEAAKSSADYATEGAEQTEGTSWKNPIKKIEGLLKFGAGVSGVIASPLAPVTKPIGQLISKAGEGYGSLPGVQKFATSKAGEVTSRVAEDVQNLGAITGTVAGVKQGTTGLQNFASRYRTMPQESPIPGGLNPKRVTVYQKEWTEPTTVNSATYNKPRAVLEKYPEAPNFLAKHGVDPWAHIEDGRYATAETAAALRDTAGKLSADTLRPSLEAANYSTQATLTSDVVSSAIKTVENSKNITALDKTQIISRLQKEGAALQKTYPKGMKLTDLHDNKITYAKSGGYSPVKSASDNNIATANRILSETLEHTLQKTAPSEIPIADFRAYQSKYYQSADYLDALNQRKVPPNVKTTAMRGIAKYGGAAIGQAFGGNVVSAFAGYSIGRALQHALENMTPALRARFISNLEITNPEAFVKVQQYLTDQTNGFSTTPRLPAPSYIPLGPKTPSRSELIIQEAQRGPVGFDPVTGRFKETYLSTPK